MERYFIHFVPQRVLNARHVAKVKARRGCEGPGPHDGKLTFHHRDPSTKLGTVSDMVSKGYRLTLVDAEIRKCIVLCVDCHRRAHGEVTKMKAGFAAKGVEGKSLNG